MFAFSSLGFFCGPILELASSWKHHVPSGGFVMLASLSVGLGVTLFTTLEASLSQSDAVYASIIAGELRCLHRFFVFFIHVDYTSNSSLGYLRG